MKFYRYEGIYTELGPRLQLGEFKLLKETPCGYWIVYTWHMPNAGYKQWKKWISKTTRKRYAYPTKEEALINFIARKEREWIILQTRIEANKVLHAKAKKLQREQQ